MINRNNFGFGLLAGIVSTALGLGFFWLVGFLLTSVTGIEPFLQSWQIRMLAMFLPVILMRYYFVNRKYDFTGKGILTMVFVFVIAYFLYLKLAG